MPDQDTSEARVVEPLAKLQNGVKDILTLTKKIKI